MLDNGVGAYNEDPAQMAQIIAKWFATEGKELEEMSAKAKLLGRPEATFNIVRELAGEYTLGTSLHSSLSGTKSP